MRRTGITLALLLISFSAAAENVPPALQTKLTAQLRGKLLEPESARITFDPVFRRSPAGGYAVCGLVNAKNTAGDYTGNRRFVFFGPSPQSELKGGVFGSEELAKAAEELCG